MAAPPWLLTVHRYAVFYFVRFLCNLFKGTGQRVKPTQNDAILKCSAVDLAAKIRRAEISSVTVLKTFIHRIQDVNPLLNCVVDNRYDEAIKEAAAADALIASGKHTVAELERDKPFLGVPISTKDSLSVKGLLHSSGLVARRNVRADKDSGGMAMMRRAGAIPFALTNVSECCMWWESHNLVHGITRNPYDSNRIVGGSSGGEGCLLGASGSPIGIGSDFGGSIRMPAFFNGVFGHKPSSYTVSNEGQWPIIHGPLLEFVGIGPMSRYATDLRPALKVMADTNAAKLNLDEPVDLSRLKVYYQLNDGGSEFISSVEYDICEAMEKAIHHFSQISHFKPKIQQIKALRQSTELFLSNIKSPPGADKFDSQLNNLQAPINAYWELLKWPFGQSNHTFIALALALVDQTGVVHGTTKHTYLVKQKDELKALFSTMLGDDGVFLYPTHPTAAPYHHETIVRAFNFSYTAIINILGLPATAIPMGIGREGLPIGIQVVANHSQDRLCLAVACELERRFGGWQEPCKV